ncbi:hypothetical protein DUNSADRAFT_12069 [Dunaliella salina]|uniref:Encoded protein n=1 Tax=Dunaliella salina TaxID=3046 RepID=A0ABQ7H430_DUNSA|nr:hypothetical protein DUNSADRAFT_12069 [Dunaliella salina]|eukprot:KAF5841613.1 hypothetical protein DUNSADRAFT_12069 [Dunaliella salina]
MAPCSQGLFCSMSQKRRGVHRQCGGHICRGSRATAGGGCKDGHRRGGQHCEVVGDPQKHALGHLQRGPLSGLRGVWRASEVFGVPLILLACLASVGSLCMVHKEKVSCA